MRHLIYITFILVTLNSFGQKKRYSIGTESGVNSISFRGNRSNGSLFKLGYSTGLTAQFRP